MALLTLLLFFSSFCTHSVCCQFCFEVLCCSVRREIYFAWLLLAVLPLWRSGNVHLWQSLLRFSSLLFLPLHTLDISVWSLLFSLDSLQLSHFCLGAGALGVKCFFTEGSCDKTVSARAPSYNEVCGVSLCLILLIQQDSPQSICLELLGAQWPRSEAWPLLLPHSESALTFPCFIIPWCFTGIFSGW